MAKAKKPIPEGYHTINVCLVVEGCDQGIAWYKKALGAEEIARMPGPDGKIMHAELKIGDSRLMVSDPMMGMKGPKALGGSPSNLMIYVEDCDTLFNRATGAGATVTMPMADMFWGDRFGSFVDPFGHKWSVATRKEDLTAAEIKQGQENMMKQMAQQQKK